MSYAVKNDICAYINGRPLPLYELSVHTRAMDVTTHEDAFHVFAPARPEINLRSGFFDEMLELCKQGDPVEVQVGRELGQSWPLVSFDTKTCRGCGWDVEDRPAFCSHCGRLNNLSCTQCGAPDAGLNLCAWCGVPWPNRFIHAFSGWRFKAFISQVEPVCSIDEPIEQRVTLVASGPLTEEGGGFR